MVTGRLKVPCRGTFRMRYTEGSTEFIVKAKQEAKGSFGKA